MIGIVIDPETGDLQVKERGLQIENTADQIAESVLMASLGDFKEYPLIGAGVLKLQHGEADLLWCAHAKQMLVAGGVPATRVYFKDNQLIIE